MLKVVNLGLGRTGTISLKCAVENLGFGKCYHFAEMYHHPEHIPMWLSVNRGEKIDWDKLFEGYQATVYWTSYGYLDLLEHYPEAKVILTVRDPETWYRSTYDTLYKYNRMTPFRKLSLLTMGLFKPELKRLSAMWQLNEQILWQNTYKGQFHNKKFAMEIFLEYIEEVKRKVPADRLLVFNVKDGWQPLCHFLKVPVPDTPFPRVNDSASFIAWRTGIFKGIFKWRGRSGDEKKKSVESFLDKEKKGGK
jgi:hypothetical protein